MYVTKGAAVSDELHKLLVIPRAEKLVREQLPTEDMLSISDSYSQASQMWGEGR